MSQNVLTVILGRKGTGKTTVAVDLISQEAKARGRVVVIDPVGEYPNGVQISPSDPALDFYLSNSRFRIAIHPVRVADLNLIVPKILRTGNLLAVIDEAQLFQDASQIPDVLIDLVTLGRRPRVDQIWITQRPTLLHKDVTSQLDVAFLFGAAEPRDLDYLGKRISVAAAEKVSQLRPFEYVRFQSPDTYTTGTVNKIQLAGQKRVPPL